MFLLNKRISGLGKIGLTQLDRVEYFIDALKKQTEFDSITPYFIESKICSIAPSLLLAEISDILHYIVGSDHARYQFQYLSKKKILKYIIPALDLLKKVPQNKGKSRNAFEHTLGVIDCVPADNTPLRWAALFHDLGKHDSYLIDKNFLHHQKFSAEIADSLCVAYSVQHSDKVCSIVKNHMYPLDYQRRPDWSTKAIKTFIERCGAEHALDVVEFSYYDKMSENNVPEFLKIIVELREKVKVILND